MSNSEQIVDVKTWLADPLPAEVRSAIARLSRTDDAVRIAIMPDVHLANDVCVGTVLATRRLIYPSAVGGDIGCGMAAMAFDAHADLLRDEMNAARLLAHLPQYVPAMRHAHRDCALVADDELERVVLSDPKLESIRRRDGVVQLGTLGRGNHFLEFQSDEQDQLWIMIHSGSRAMGPAIRDLHLQKATRSSAGFLHLDSESAEGQAYLADAAWGTLYARYNRKVMADGVIELMNRLFAAVPVTGSYFDCDHNHVRQETHFGEQLWVHRKGAASARENEPAMIPGSMGTESFHTHGRGCTDALRSSSHGAGRKMSRADARKRTNAVALAHQLRGVWYDRRLERSLREEAPAAYKDIHHVMRAQHDLTRIARRLHPILSYKSG